MTFRQPTALPWRKGGFDSRWAIWQPCPTAQAYKLSSLVEHQIDTLGVTGSIPVVTPNAYVTCTGAKRQRRARGGGFYVYAVSSDAGRTWAVQSLGSCSSRGRVSLEGPSPPLARITTWRSLARMGATPMPATFGSDQQRAVSDHLVRTGCSPLKADSH